MVKHYGQYLLTYNRTLIYLNMRSARSGQFLKRAAVHHDKGIQRSETEAEARRLSWRVSAYEAGERKRKSGR